MRTQTYNLTNKDVTLTTYILDSSFDHKKDYKRPAVLVFPGGGYGMCSNREAEPIAMHFLAMGYNAFILRYSLNENSMFPQPLQDAEEAMQMIIDNCDEWLVDAEKIAVCGFSAGGHLAAALGTMGKIRPAAMILGYPCITKDICNDVDVLKNHENVPVLDDKVDENTPPAFIFASSDDGLVPIRSSIKFAEALSEKGIPHQMHIFSEGGHGFSTADYVTCEGRFEFSCAQWISLCREWLYNLFIKPID